MTRTMIGVLMRVTTDMTVSSGTPTVRHSRDSSSEEERGKGGGGREERRGGGGEGRRREGEGRRGEEVAGHRAPSG